MEEARGTPDPLAAKRHQMVKAQLRARGIRDERVLRAMEQVPRERFLPPECANEAYEDRALGVEHGQTISQPFIVAYMTEQLRVGGQNRILEVGTGTGYQTAILSLLGRVVFTVERIPALLEHAQEALNKLELNNIQFKLGDGTLGWTEQAPFDRIIVTAGGPDVPPALIEQLADPGRLIAPAGPPEGQYLVLVIREHGQLTRKELIGCRFVPLLGVEGWRP